MTGNTDNIESRRRGQCDAITSLAERNPSFSFLRLGDGEIAYLVNHQQGKMCTLRGSTLGLQSGCENGLGTLGLGANHHDRLQRSYEQCNYLDRYQNQEANQKYLELWQCARRPDGSEPLGNDYCAILPFWVLYQFKEYLSRHNVLMCGAEAGVLQALLRRPEYTRLTSGYFPARYELTFHVPPRNGQDLASDLDTLKDEIKQLLAIKGCDTVMLSLGGAAKIIGYEISQECQVRAFDFGAMTRALTYSGSDGCATWRSSHNIFMGRVPFDVYMDAIETAFPDERMEVYVAKAICQVCLELQRKELAVSVPCDLHDAKSYDPNPDNLRRFWESYERLWNRYGRISRRSSSCRDLMREFEKWRQKKGLGFRGKVFRALVRAKTMLRAAGVFS